MRYAILDTGTEVPTFSLSLSYSGCRWIFTWALQVTQAHLLHSHSQSVSQFLYAIRLHPNFVSIPAPCNMLIHREGTLTTTDYTLTDERRLDGRTHCPALHCTRIATRPYYGTISYGITSRGTPSYGIGSMGSAGPDQTRPDGQGGNYTTYWM